MVASDLTIPAHGGLPVFSILRTPSKNPPPPKEGYLLHPPSERLQKDAGSQRLRIIPVTLCYPRARHSSRLGQRLQVALGTAAALAAISLSPGSAQAYVVTVGGVQYDVTTFTGSYDNNTSKFRTPANGGVMPWFGNATLATQFANAVGYNLGRLPSPENYRGPNFAVSNAIDSYSNAIVSYSYADFGTYGYPADPTISTVWAQVLPAAPTAAPGPLPLFGGAAAFGFSRKLRKRIKLAPGALASSQPMA